VPDLRRPEFLPPVVLLEDVPVDGIASVEDDQLGSSNRSRLASSSRTMNSSISSERLDMVSSIIVNSYKRGCGSPGRPARLVRFRHLAATTDRSRPVAFRHWLRPGKPTGATHPCHPSAHTRHRGPDGLATALWSDLFVVRSRCQRRLATSRRRVRNYQQTGPGVFGHICGVLDGVRSWNRPKRPSDPKDCYVTYKRGTSAGN